MRPLIVVTILLVNTPDLSKDLFEGVLATVSVIDTSNSSCCATASNRSRKPVSWLC
ncbi:hypothetical protein GCM10023172_00020 [Hymenobacter ginsengisoli]|uniref:Uncharacterized protein n=1 Tax=Hymenobacter ginsengisoli TaxID=1051626 RepID=A0ABP8PWL5_9BACT|nr:MULTISPECIES: hypothetical protein [unclassified Hymenobacter]MBO2033728.1 hypothetical protein [Hymenobacter sp. BT559]